MTSEVRALLEGASALLLDFDGPLAALMPPPRNAQAADAARSVLGGVDLPAVVASTTDHLAVLRWSLEHLPRPRVLEVEAACAHAEVRAAAHCQVAANCIGLLSYAKQADMLVAVVSNNAREAVDMFLHRTGWIARVDAISARTPETVGCLKPKPDLLLTAADALRIDIGTALFVGDAVSDVIAAKRAGCKVVGLYKNAERMQELASAGADGLGELSRPVLVEP